MVGDVCSVYPSCQWVEQRFLYRKVSRVRIRIVSKNEKRLKRLTPFLRDMEGRKNLAPFECKGPRYIFVNIYVFIFSNKNKLFFSSNKCLKGLFSEKKKIVPKTKPYFLFVLFHKKRLKSFLKF